MSVKKRISEVSRTKGDLTACLDFHGVSNLLQEQLLFSVKKESKAQGGAEVLKVALEDNFSFCPLSFSKNEDSILLVGAPGVGKTVISAKLAAQALEEGKKPVLLTLDTWKAGAVHQLKTYGEALGVEVFVCDGPDAFKKVLEEDCQQDNFLIVDTPGIDPRLREDVEALAQIIYLWNQPPVLCLSAAADSFLSEERAISFAQLGADRMIITQGDLTSRWGAMMNAAYRGKYALSAVNQTPYIGRPYLSLGAEKLSNLLLDLWEEHRSFQDIF